MQRRGRLGVSDKQLLTIQLFGEVANHVYEIGFGFRFINLSDAQTEFLEVFVDTLRD